MHPNGAHDDDYVMRQQIKKLTIDTKKNQIKEKPRQRCCMNETNDNYRRKM